MSKKRIFKTKLFSKWLKKTVLTDRELVAAVKEMEFDERAATCV